MSRSHVCENANKKSVGEVVHVNTKGLWTGTDKDQGTRHNQPTHLAFLNGSLDLRDWAPHAA